MKKLTKMILCALFFLGACIFSGSVDCHAALTVVLDPGHDATHTGANANGVAEEVVNYKIAQYCYEELQKYEGLGNVLLTRNGMSCPYPGTTSTQCNKKRVEFSKGVGADIYVSLHNNSASSTSARGATVYYPNSNYNSAIGVAGQRLATIVQSRLVSLGLANRGIQIRNSEDNTRYPDGSLADYYGVIKNSKLSGFSAIIIEHAFLTNSGDVANYLTTENQLKLLGIADATGIAEYYGLKKKDVWDNNVSNAKLSVSDGADYRSVNASVSGLSKAPGVWIAVWSSENGQDDLKWYTMSKDSSGNWNVNVPISDFKRSGVYYVHAYVVDGNKTIFACTGSFNVGEPSASGISLKEMDYLRGGFIVETTGVSSRPGIGSVTTAVWTKPDQSDLKWIPAENKGGGVYYSRVDFADFAYTEGSYQIHVYAMDNNGIQRLVKTMTQKVVFPDAEIGTALTDNDSRLLVEASGIVYPSRVAAVKAAIWSDDGGQDDIVWYDMKKSADFWTVDVDMAAHLTTGSVNIHVYSIMDNGVAIFGGGAVVYPEEMTNTKLYNAVTGNDGEISWRGSFVDITASHDALVVSKKDDDTLSGTAVTVTGDAAEVTDTSITATGDGVEVTQGAVTGEGTSVSGEASGSDKEMLSPADYVRMSQTVFTRNNSWELYWELEKLLTERNGGVHENFYAAKAELITDDDYGISINEPLKMRFLLPVDFRSGGISVYSVSKSDDGYRIGDVCEAKVMPDGYCSISSETDGLFIIARGYHDLLEGDVNLDGTVNLLDANLSLRVSLGITSFSYSQRLVADVNYDNSINLKDTNIILMKALGIVP